MSKPYPREFGERLAAAREVLVAAHIRPDGDAVGSVLGLGLTLRAAGKSVRMVLADGVPQNFQHLEGAADIHRRVKGGFDLTVILDCADYARAGEVAEKIAAPDLNIDHHATNTRFARHNLVIEDAVSTTEILYNLLTSAGFAIPPGAAAGLLTGLITDSLGFVTSSITPAAMRTAASLMELGADLPVLYRKALLEKSFAALRFWGAGLTLLERDGPLVWATLKMEDRKNAGYPGRDDADLINQISAIRDGDIRLIFVEQPDNQVKVSWRSGEAYDVARVAQRFGGGGHRVASGAMIDGSLEEVRAIVLEVTREVLLYSDHETNPN
jgi:phosphoesterase RecJ-like protein